MESSLARRRISVPAKVSPTYAQQLTGLRVGIERPSVVTAREFYTTVHNNGDGVYSRPSKLRAIPTPFLRPSQPRRHSTPPHLSSHHHLPRTVREDSIASDCEIHKEYLGLGKRKLRDFEEVPKSKLPASPRQPPDNALPVHPIPSRSQSTRIFNPLEPRYLGNIPFHFTSRRLQDWGHVYLYNGATADVLVRAIPLPREVICCERGICEIPSMNTPPSNNRNPSDAEMAGVTQSNGWQLPSPNIEMITAKFERMQLEDKNIAPVPQQQLLEKISNLQPSRSVRVKVRILPNNSDRDRLIIEKSFPINLNLRRLSSFERYSYYSEHILPQAATKASDSLQCTSNDQNYPFTLAFPIHIEYAVYRAPLLGAILLSGFVLKGDTIEVPMPWPEVWEETIVAIYTGFDLEDEKETYRDTGEEQRQKVWDNLAFLRWSDVRE